MRRQGFTLIELVVVITVIGILASLAMGTYTRVIEKSRTGEARSVMSQIRDAELAYYHQREIFTTNIAELGIVVPTSACAPEYYYRYSIGLVGATFEVVASRCTVGGKPPVSPLGAYTISLFGNGTLNSTDSSVL